MANDSECSCLKRSRYFKNPWVYNDREREGERERGHEESGVEQSPNLIHWIPLEYLGHQLLALKIVRKKNVFILSFLYELYFVVTK